MANICKNILIVSGGRNELINLIQSNELSYKQVKIFQLKETSLCVPFQSNWNPPEDFLVELSRQHKTLEFTLYYIEKLLGKAGRIVYTNGVKEKKGYNLSLGLFNSVGFSNQTIKEDLKKHL